MKFEVIDKCPVPAKLAPALQRIKSRSGASLVSCDRSPAAEPLLKQNGKMSQRELFEGFKAGRPGFNPANPPGRSTHERRNDGIAYPGPARTPLPYWCVGMDWSNAKGVVAAAKQEGFIATITYPGNKRELHHVNFRKEPRVPVQLKPLKLGMKGARVKKLTQRLMIVKDPDTGTPYLDQPSMTFTERVEKAVKSFQFDHDHHTDGIVGPQTQRQLMASVRFHVHKNKT